MKAFRERMVRGMMGVLIGFAVIFIIFVSAFEIACYSDYGFYQKEYEKYDVNNKTSIVNMDMDELMKVTKEMMQYLCGNREELVIYAQVDGTEKKPYGRCKGFVCGSIAAEMDLRGNHCGFRPSSICNIWIQKNCGNGMSGSRMDHSLPCSYCDCYNSSSLYRF